MRGWVPALRWEASPFCVPTVAPLALTSRAEGPAITGYQRAAGSIEIMRIEIPVHLRWSDMDAYGHVNNVDMLRLLEVARIEAFWVSEQSEHRTGILDASPGAATATFAARQEIEYLAPLSYRRDPVVVELWIGHIGGASIDISYRIRDAHNQVIDNDQPDPLVYAIASTTLVMVDTKTNVPRRLSTNEREIWAPYVHEPIEFKHRR